jgi:hypothetical protein
MKPLISRSPSVVMPFGVFDDAHEPPALVADIIGSGGSSLFEPTPAPTPQEVEDSHMLTSTIEQNHLAYDARAPVALKDAYPLSEGSRTYRTLAPKTHTGATHCPSSYGALPDATTQDYDSGLFGQNHLMSDRMWPVSQSPQRANLGNSMQDMFVQEPASETSSDFPKWHDSSRSPRVSDVTDSVSLFPFDSVTASSQLSDFPQLHSVGDQESTANDGKQFQLPLSVDHASAVGSDFDALFEDSGLHAQSGSSQIQSSDEFMFGEDGSKMELSIMNNGDLGKAERRPQETAGRIWTATDPSFFSSDKVASHAPPAIENESSGQTEGFWRQQSPIDPLPFRSNNIFSSSINSVPAMEFASRNPTLFPEEASPDVSTLFPLTEDALFPTAALPRRPSAYESDALQPNQPFNQYGSSYPSLKIPVRDNGYPTFGNPSQGFDGYETSPVEGSTYTAATIGNPRNPSLPTTPRRVDEFGRRDTSLDQQLVDLRHQGYSYKQIKEELGCPEAESTLRGRFRALTTPREMRPRKPTWPQYAVSNHTTSYQADRLY